MRIRPGTHVGMTANGTARIGGGAREVVLKGLSVAQLQVIDRLAAGQPLGTPQPGTEEVAERAHLLSELRPWLEDVDPAQAMPGLAAERLRPDARAWSGVWGPAGEGTLGAERFLARTHARVWISELDRVGLGLAVLLAAAGVGRLAVPGGEAVHGEDLGTSPLRLTELGMPRPAGLARHLARLYPHAHVLSPVEQDEGFSGADVAVLIQRHGVHPSRVEQVRAARAPVLPLVFHPDGFRLGPVARVGGCEECVLRAWESQRTDETHLGRSCPPELTLTTTAVGLAAQSVLMLLDGVCPPAVTTGTLVGSLATGHVETEPLPPVCGHAKAA